MVGMVEQGLALTLGPVRMVLGVPLRRAHAQSDREPHSGPRDGDDASPNDIGRATPAPPRAFPTLYPRGRTHQWAIRPGLPLVYPWLFENNCGRPLAPVSAL